MTTRLGWKPKPPRLRRLPRVTPDRTRKTMRAAPEAGDDQRISHDTRMFVWARDHGRCRNCGSTKDLQFDHIIPRSWGGAGNAENVELLCQDCNLKKRAQLYAPRKLNANEGSI